MKLRRLSENVFILLVNFAFAFLQTILCIGKVSELNIFALIYTLALIMVGIIVIAIWQVNSKHNLLVKNGRLIKAKMNPDDVKIIFALKSCCVVGLVCYYFDGNSVRRFEEQYFCAFNRYRHFKKLIDKPIDVDVISSNDYKYYHIITSSIDGGILKEDTLYCPEFFNYVLIIYNAILLLINILNLILEG